MSLASGELLLKLDLDQLKLLAGALDARLHFMGHMVANAELQANQWLARRKPEQAQAAERRSAEYQRRILLTQAILAQLPDTGVLPLPKGDR